MLLEWSFVGQSRRCFEDGSEPGVGIVYLRFPVFRRAGGGHEHTDKFQVCAAYTFITDASTTQIEYEFVRMQNDECILEIKGQYILQDCISTFPINYNYTLIYIGFH